MTTGQTDWMILERRLSNLIVALASFRPSLKWIGAQWQKNGKIAQKDALMGNADDPQTIMLVSSVLEHVVFCGERNQ